MLLPDLKFHVLWVYVPALYVIKQKYCHCKSVSQYSLIISVCNNSCLSEANKPFYHPSDHTKIRAFFYLLNKSLCLVLCCGVFKLYFFQIFELSLIDFVEMVKRSYSKFFRLKQILGREECTRNSIFQWLSCVHCWSILLRNNQDLSCSEGFCTSEKS